MQKKLYYKIACTIAGSDSGGGAGIQADLKTFSALGVFGTSVITAITAQNTLGVRGIQAIEPEILKKQLQAVFEDFQPDAVKIGMLYNTDAVMAVSECLDRYQPKYVVLDPVMVAESGSSLIKNETIQLIEKELFHRVSIVTPNVSEAEIFSGISIENVENLKEAGKKILQKGAFAVLVKGGHLAGEKKIDVLMVRNSEPILLSLPTVKTENTHGTGCTLSSAITAYLALGNDLSPAVEEAKYYLHKALQTGAGVTIGHGHGPVNHFFDPKPLQIFEK